MPESNCIPPITSAPSQPPPALLQPWQTLLPDLMAAAAEESPVAPAGKQRALRALKHVLQALKSECLIGAVPLPCSMLRCGLW